MGSQGFKEEQEHREDSDFKTAMALYLEQARPCVGRPTARLVVA